MVAKSIKEQLEEQHKALGGLFSATEQCSPLAPPNRRVTPMNVDPANPRFRRPRSPGVATHSDLRERGDSPPRAPRHEHQPADPDWESRVKHRQRLKRLGLPFKGSTCSNESSPRESHCYHCRSRVDSQRHHLCNQCSRLRIICPNCGACGCGYSSPATTTADDFPFGDDVDSWIVSDDGVIVFPDSLSGVTEVTASERRDAYSAYLQSPTWRTKRFGALKLARFRCEECGSKGKDLHVHHVSYVRVGGDETPEDLQVLCSDCHYHHHSVAKAYIEHFRESPK